MLDEGVGFEAQRAYVQTFLGNRELRASWSQLDHLQWARGMPAMSCRTSLPEFVTPALCCGDPGARRAWQQCELNYWQWRKTRLHDHWCSVYEGLPGHVRDVVGKHQNLCLLREMLEAAGSPDTALVDDLLRGACAPRYWGGCSVSHACVRGARGRLPHRGGVGAVW